MKVGGGFFVWVAERWKLGICEPRKDERVWGRAEAKKPALRQSILWSSNGLGSGMTDTVV